jgi:O-antigen/teichoic acid export membrane protein
VLIGLVTFIDALGWAHASRLIGLEGWRAVSPLRLVSQVAGTLLGVGAIVLDLGLPGVFAAQALASTWLTVMLRRRDRRHRPDLDIAPVPLVMRPLVRLWSLYAVGALLTQVVNKRIELVFLDAFRSPHEVAVYAVAFTVISVAVTVPSSLMGAALPGISAADAAGNETELHGHLHRAARLAILGGFLLTAGLVVLGPYLVLALWGGQFTAAARIVPWLAVAMLGTPLGVLLDVYWTAVNRLGAVLVTGAVSAVVDLGLAAALVPSLGVPGAVTANLAGQLTWLAGLIVYTRRRIPGLLPPASFLGRCAASALAAGAAAWAAAALLGGLGAFVGLVGGGLAFLAALALLGRTLGLVAAPDLEWLGGLLPTVARPLLAALGGRTSARQEHGPGSDQPVVTSSR